MPIMKLFEARTCVSRRLMPNVSELNGTAVNAGGAVPGGSPRVHMPTTGAAFDSLGAPVSSSEVTATDRVRFACAVMVK